MITKSKTYRMRMLFFLIVLGITGCTSNENNASIKCYEAVFCVVLAHPDDETIIGGTLSMLAEKGIDLTIVYVTSGDDGPDMTGKDLYGNELGEVRENEAKQALQALGVVNPPIFLGYPDGHIHEYVDSIRHTLCNLFEKISPQAVISFGPDGITGSMDHEYTGCATDSAFALSDSGKLLLHMAITKPLSPFYARGVAVPRDTIDIRVDVTKYKKQRKQAVGAHHTQFDKRVQSAYSIYVHTMRKEKFIIASNRGNTERLVQCF